MTAPRIHILHENDDWLPPLRAALEAAGVPFEEWRLDGGSIDLASTPPEGVFWSRLSASSHTRDHEHAKEYARAVYRWLEAHGRRVVNGSRVVELEVSKVAQYAALAAAGFDVPRTIAVFGTADLGARARELPLPFITKHNQGGKGLGVRRFDSYEEFDAYIAGGEFEQPVDGITLLQEYVQTAEPFVTRAEFVGGDLVYAVRVDTSAGSFELCPAEACAVPAADVPGGPATVAGLLGNPVAPVLVQGFAAAACDVPGASLFSVRDDVDAAHPFIERLGAFLAAQGVEVAGVEYFETADGRLVPYDINTNTNYSPDVESATGAAGAAAVAAYLGRALAADYAAVSA
ncbi:glutathione synthase [Cnuibacter physcomitrellae]|uniref:Alpha-L-glutamate ligase n=1 Tax=Cnuibacter physcomitrellae TaxID=1619308 RepID=A0A1X9LJ35_9MICO|nr:alpha-L-glutamate ligase [Cnuibacter physcomitrellae]ARJ05183.1 alpha-L-glutamate ligase [Cnuibacter physcomitrellae]GGI35139.1 glutathione synthase [Cnuibacter physcomitrellae]